MSVRKICFHGDDGGGWGIFLLSQIESTCNKDDSEVSYERIRDCEFEYEY